MRSTGSDASDNIWGELSIPELQKAFQDLIHVRPFLAPWIRFCTKPNYVTSVPFQRKNEYSPRLFSALYANSCWLSLTRPRFHDACLKCFIMAFILIKQHREDKSGRCFCQRYRARAFALLPIHPSYSPRASLHSPTVSSPISPLESSLGACTKQTWNQDQSNRRYCKSQSGI